MPKHECDRVVTAIARQPWAITPDGLELVLGIAQRNISDQQAVLAAPTGRRESGKVQMRDGVAVISVMGPIFPRADFFTEISGATSIETLALRFGEAVAADDVKAIVLHVDSPGGSVTGVHEFGGQIFAARNVKPVVAYVSGACTSAAYWLASAAKRVVADETGLLGSIGVVAAWTDDKEARKSAGLTDYEVVSSQSPNKRLDPTSQEGRAALQQLLDADADIFIADVARNRGKRVSTVAEQFGQGGCMLAAAAVKVGMIDEIGSLEGVISSLSDAASRTNRGEVLATANKEIVMDKETLAKAHPELLAQIQAEAKEQAKAEAAHSQQAALASAAATHQALVRVVAGDGVAAQVEKLSSAGFTVEQVEALTPMLAAVQMANATQVVVDAKGTTGGQLSAEAHGGSSGQADVLAALRAATPSPVNTSAAPQNTDPVQAAIDQISSQQL